MPMLKTSDGVALHYVDEGPREAPVLMLVPGWGGSTVWFEEQVRGLSDQFRVICYDPRGQGQSERTARGQRMERVSKDLDDVINALELRDVVLLGWSLGVSTVLSYVDVFGCSALRRAVLVCGGPRLINGAGWELGFVDLQQAVDWIELQRGGMEAAADFVLPRFFATEPAPRRFAQLRRSITEMSAAGSSAMCWNVLNQDYTDVPAKLSVPTAVLSGRHDTVIPAANGPLLVESIADARLRIFESSAHCPFLEQPDEFNKVLEEILV